MYTLQCAAGRYGRNVKQNAAYSSTCQALVMQAYTRFARLSLCKAPPRTAWWHKSGILPPPSSSRLWSSQNSTSFPSPPTTKLSEGGSLVQLPLGGAHTYIHTVPTHSTEGMVVVGDISRHIYGVAATKPCLPHPTFLPGTLTHFMKKQEAYNWLQV